MNLLSWSTGVTLGPEYVWRNRWNVFLNECNYCCLIGIDYVRLNGKTVPSVIGKKIKISNVINFPFLEPLVHCVRRRNRHPPFHFFVPVEWLKAIIWNVVGIIKSKYFLDKHRCQDKWKLFLGKHFYLCDLWRATS